MGTFQHINRSIGGAKPVAGFTSRNYRTVTAPSSYLSPFGNGVRAAITHACPGPALLSVSEEEMTTEERAKAAHIRATKIATERGGGTMKDISELYDQECAKEIDAAVREELERAKGDVEIWKGRLDAAITEGVKPRMERDEAKGLVNSALPILRTVAEGECIYDGLHGVTCEMPWPEGPDGRAPDGGPACEPCRSQAWLAKLEKGSGS